MIPRAYLESTARSYLRAAKILNRQAYGSYDAAAYLCGYAIEIALKARICRTLGWLGYPETSGEFQNYRSFQTHDFDVLLHLSGRAAEDRIKSHPLSYADWSTVKTWKPEQRYHPVGSKSPVETRDMISATTRLMRIML